MSLKLYFAPGACSFVPHALLEAAGAEFEPQMVKLHKNEQNSPEYKAINPRGQVPVLVDDGTVIREGAAIIIYLLEKHASSLLPKSGKEQAAALEWLMFANASLHPVYGRGFMLMKTELDKPAKDKLMAMTVESINKLWKEADEKLAKSKYLAGDTLTAADILATVIANWSSYFPGITLGANVSRLLKEVSSRPAFKKAMEAEKVEYKAAA